MSEINIFENALRDITAAGEHVAFGAFAASGNRADMAHGQFFCGQFSAAVVADAAPLPPLGLPKFSNYQIIGFKDNKSRIRNFHIGV
jgi:hypothetical protein